MLHKCCDILVLSRTALRDVTATCSLSADDLHQITCLQARACSAMLSFAVTPVLEGSGFK